jgi:hypothetical protein
MMFPFLLSNDAPKKSFEYVYDCLFSAAGELTVKDPSIRSIGIAGNKSGYYYRVIRNTLMRENRPIGNIKMPHNFLNIPVQYIDTKAEVIPHVKIAPGGPAVPSGASFYAEQLRSRPLYCGLQIQNYDNDIRTGNIAKGNIEIGSIGCFVRLSNDPSKLAILSNNHTVAGENRGLRGTDRILQPGALSAIDQVAVLEDYTPLQYSIPGNTPMVGGVIYNDIDAGIAVIDEPTIKWKQEYLPYHTGLPTLSGTATGQLNDVVFKIGRTTGLTRGEVKDSGTIVGPVPYTPGPAWFSDSMTIETNDGSPFSLGGDSGAVVVKETGEIIGLLYAGNGKQSYACPIDKVLFDLSCTLA